MKERERIANGLGINPVTLVRWVNGESRPRLQTLWKLPSLLPEIGEVLRRSIEEEFSPLAAREEEKLMEDGSGMIAVELYARVLHTLALVPQSLRFTSLCDLILQQALEQLDPYRLGIAMIVASCMPPSQGNKIRSLREILGRGTPPWERTLEEQAVFLGAESLTGASVLSGHLVTNQRLEEVSLAAGYQSDWEASAAAIPILHVGSIAGALLVSSTQRDYFIPGRCVLIEHYAELLALAFSPDEFFASELIDLWTMPPAEVQRPYFSEFRRRLMQLLRQNTGNSQPMTLLKGQQIIWQQIEEELLQRGFHRE